MAISLSTFDSQYDNKPKQLDFSEWKHFEKFLYMLAGRALAGKRDAPLVSPAIYVPDTTRANKNVIGWAGWAAVDVDDVEIEGDIKDYVLKLAGDWKFICYSTASSRPGKVKFRMVFELDGHIPADKIKHFWFALQSKLDESGDKQCKDLSRMYYIPATYNEAYNFIFSQEGNTIDSDALLAAYPYAEKRNSNNFMDRLPDAIQNAVIEHRKNAMTDASFHWSGYHDCPFWPQRMANEYRVISDAGWYSKMYGMMVAIAGRAISKGYPITSNQVADLCKQFDAENGNWYENRPLNVEADRAIEYAYRNN